MLDKFISYSFYLLFFLTPLLWTSKNYELFEYNKMILVYGFTVIIVGSWLLKIINLKSLIFNRTPLDIPLLLFLGANILSTIFSIDVHTSVWGYYSRSNGGLLSLISYLLLYYAFVSNMDFNKALTTLKFGLASGFLISLYAILEHFGVSPSCVILRGEFNADCWIQRVQERVFATLGQPNWLAAYLAMLIFPALYFALTATKKLTLYTYYIILAIYYLAFTFTYSRGPTLGMLVGMGVFIVMLFLERMREVTIKNVNVFKEISQFVRKINKFVSGEIKPVLIVLTSFLVINLLFGSALTSFRLVSKFAAPVRPGITIPTTPSGTQLENGGTESGQIRLIVWKGALDIFKHYPLFGSGLETFAYSYYQYRPPEHNLTSEWDFLYNKAHNEYLNYLATTGIVGFGAYMLVIGAFIFWSFQQLKTQKLKVKTTTQNLKVNQSKFSALNSNFTLYTLHFTLLASYISYLIYNFFLFSVVIIAIFFYLFPAIAFVSLQSTKPLRLPRFLTSHFSLLTSIIYRRPLYTKAAYGIVTVSIFYLLSSIFQLWYADTVFNSGQKTSDSGNVGKAYNLLSEAVDLNPGEPFYRSELAFSAAAAAAALNETDATLSASLKDEALLQTQKVLTQSPNNVSYWRTAIRTYFELATLDNKYIDSTIETIDYTIKLAPTDPKLYYNKALVLQLQGKKTEEIQALQTALQLKPNYLEVIDQLKQATSSAKP